MIVILASDDPTARSGNTPSCARLGVVILPPNPGFYQQPDSIDDLVDFVVARILDQLAIENDLSSRWGSSA